MTDSLHFAVTDAHIEFARKVAAARMRGAVNVSTFSLSAAEGTGNTGPMNRNWSPSL